LHPDLRIFDLKQASFASDKPQSDIFLTQSDIFLGRKIFGKVRENISFGRKMILGHWSETFGLTKNIFLTLEIISLTNSNIFEGPKTLEKGTEIISVGSKSSD
jgi:hypothetical protein